MRGYMETLVVSQEYYSEIFDFIYEKKIFANFDFEDDYVVYYFQNPFYYEITKEFITDVLKVEYK